MRGTVDCLKEKYNQIKGSYYQLIFLVGNDCKDRNKALKELQKIMGLSLININIELSKKMINYTTRQRKIYIPRTLNEIITEVGTKDIILNNIEILFDKTLSQDPLKLLLKLSRNKVVIAGWNGYIEQDHILYAEPGHPEYHKYLIKDFSIIDLQY